LNDHRLKWIDAAAAAGVIVVTWLSMWGLKSGLGLDWVGTFHQFVELADSFLHGHLDLREGVIPQVDRIAFQGKMYLYTPPLGAVLMVPWVWLLGPNHFPQRAFGMVFGALNAGLFYCLFRRFSVGLRQALTPRRAAALALIFALGSSNLYFAVWSNVWYLGQLTAMSAYLAALAFAVDRRPEKRASAAAFSGFFYGAACVGRLYLVLSFPVMLFLLWSDEQYKISAWPTLSFLSDPKRRRRLLMFAAPAALWIALYALYNYARFGLFFETGMRYVNLRFNSFAAATPAEMHGLRFIPQNIYYLLLRIPRIRPYGEYITLDGFGFSVFLQIPILLLAFARTPKAWRHFSTAAWISIAAMTLPVFTYFAMGYMQFGARYFNEALPLLALLILVKRSSYSEWTLMGLGAFSIFVNVWGINVYHARTLFQPAPWGVLLAIIAVVLWNPQKVLR
jgi:hypothetical protein